MNRWLSVYDQPSHLGGAVILSHLINAIKLGAKVAAVAGPALKNVDWNDISARTLGTKLPASLHANAHVVATLNQSLAQDRVPWTTTSLAIFIVAHTSIRDNVLGSSSAVTWLKSPDEIAAYLLHGTSLVGDRRDSLHASVVQQCAEIIDVPSALLPHAPQHKAIDTDSESQNGVDTSIASNPSPLNSSDNGFAESHYAQRIAIAAKQSVGATTEIVMQQRRTLRERKTIKSFACTLLEAGYSTSQCFELLSRNSFALTNINTVLSEDLTAK